MLNAEFVESIKALTERGVKPEIVDVAENKRAIVIGGQIVETFKKDEPFGDLQVADFVSLVDAATLLNESSDQSVIKVCDNAIQCCCDANKPHKKASVGLVFKFSEAFTCLKNWMGAPKSVAAINKLLRTQLAGTFDEGKLLPIFKQIEFARSGATTVAKANHRDTMGKLVDNAVKSAAGEIPEFIAFTLPLFTNIPTEHVRLLFFVEANHDNETIGISPVGDTISSAEAAIVASLIDRLKEKIPTALVVAG